MVGLQIRVNGPLVLVGVRYAHSIVGYLQHQIYINMV